MNRTVYKYPLDITDVQDVLLPVGATILSVAAISKDTDRVSVYNAKLFLWAAIDLDETKTECQTIFIVGTDNPIPPEATRFLGTVFTSPLVWHIFTKE